MYELIVLALTAAVVWLARDRNRTRRELDELKKTTDAAWRAIEQLAHDGGAAVRRPRRDAEARATVAPPAASPAVPPLAAGPGGAERAIAAGMHAAEDMPARPAPAPAAPSATASPTAPPTAPPMAAGPPVRPAPPPARPRRSAASLEQFLGVRGAAILGGVAFVIASFSALKAVIDRGWLGPEARVVLGLIAGVGSMVGSGPLFRRKLTAAANALAGAGAATLYAVAWAAYRRYALIGLAPAFALMALVTVASGLLSVRRASLVVAILGLVGGFATPLVLSTGEDNPVGLFSYVMLLDIGVLMVALRQRWPQLGLLGVLATAAMQAAWVLARFTPERFFVALVILALFGLLFALLGYRVPEDERRQWKIGQVIGAVTPFVLAVHIALRGNLVVPLVPMAVFGTILSLAALLLARAHGEPRLALLGVGGVLSLFAVWLATTVRPTSLSTVACVWIAVAAVHHLLLEWELRASRSSPVALPAVPVLVNGLVLLACVLLHWDVARGPWAVPAIGWALAALALREARLAGSSWIATVVAVLVTVLFVGRFATAIELIPAAREIALLVATALAAQAAAVLGRRGEPWIAGERAAAIFAVGANVGLGLLATVGPLAHQPRLALAAALVLGVLALLAAARAGRGAWAFAAMVSVVLVHGAWQGVGRGLAEPLWLGLPFHAVAVVVFGAAPFVLGARFAASRPAWRAAALAPVVWLLPARDAWLRAWGDGAIGLLPLLLAVASVAGASRARRVFAGDDGWRRWSLAWFAAVALGLVSVAIPMQLEREWITIGWALEGVALMVLFERLDQVGLKYVAVAFLATVCVRLCGNAAVLGYHPRGHLPVLNWLLYTYGIPAAALVESARRLAPIEVARIRPRERSWLYASPRPWLAGALGLAAVVVVFVWINLTIADAFGAGTYIELDFSRLAQARNLTTSVAWALYAVVLLLLGVARGIVPLRWVALVVLFVAVNKVFLWDLSSLTGLYRAVSFLGLAIGLLLVSLLYQRFVYRKEPE
ncbi:MAG: DUF2339 domain-containing protein [bacterium]